MEGGMVRYRLEFTGTVQGVGFRPFVYRLAQGLRLVGFVQNTSKGVAVEIEGDEDDCIAFINTFKTKSPPLSKITDIFCEEVPLCSDSSFVILPSVGGERNALISPDVAVCDECKNEIFDKKDRRYRYPFTNCTNCGPRFSIIEDVPYDRKSTSMAAFAMCPDCTSEYGEPRSRRFHAQPDACPVCGPTLRFLTRDGELSGDPIKLFAEYIRGGGIVAVKGIGGYHLACDALNTDAVRLLRQRKGRYEKPFALMVRDIDTAKTLCELSADEERLLRSPQAPIVLLKKKDGCPAAAETAPGNNSLGLMLPYTPLHCLITDECPALVMTSANVSESPMIYEAENEKKLYDLAEAVLTHNREIVRRVDDSVARVSGGKTRLLRRSRGYAPDPIKLTCNSKTILALGAEQNNTFCLLKGENAFLSSHIGDLDDPGAINDFRRETDAFIKLFDAQPDMLVCDLHPDYFSTSFADTLQNAIPVMRVQHHHAHFASVIAENDINGDAIGFIFDGTGYGGDDTIWGGEMLFGGKNGIKRAGHLLPFPLLGGEAAVKEPWRCALSVISASMGDEQAASFFGGKEMEAHLLLEARKKGINAPLTSSMGRLFDAVAAIAGISSAVSYEGQAAIALEQALDLNETGSYNFDILEADDMLIFDWRGLIEQAVNDAQKGVNAGVISARFHRAVVNMMLNAAEINRDITGCKTVALSGGCFQNEFLLTEGIQKLENAGFAVYSNALIPAGDGGISFGQAALATWSV